MAFENPASIFFDTKGVELAVSRSQALDSTLTGSAAQAGFLVAGSSSTGIVNFLNIDSNGAALVTGSFDINDAQGNHGTPDQSWYMVITDGTSSQALGAAEAGPLWITGTVDTLGPEGTAADPMFVTGSVAILEQPISVTGSLTTSPEKCPSATVSGTNATITPVQLLAANGNRCGATFFYNGSKTVYLKFGTGASATDFTVRLSALAYYELPFNYTGVVTAVWDTTGGGAGTIQTTEVTNP